MSGRPVRVLDAEATTAAALLFAGLAVAVIVPFVQDMESLRNVPDFVFHQR